jgi:hypothetical protein
MRAIISSVWAGRISGWLAAGFLIFGAVAKLLALPPVVAATTELGYPVTAIFTLGILELVCTLIFLVPRTSVLGAILLTGYLGGAVATHVRLAHPLLSHVLFPTYVGILLWGSVFLRDARIRVLVPFRAVAR